MRNVWNAANTHVSRDAYQEKKRMKVLSMGVRDEVTKLYSISGAQKTSNLLIASFYSTEYRQRI